MACCHIRAKNQVLKTWSCSVSADLMTLELHLLSFFSIYSVFILDGQLKFVSKFCRQICNNVKIECDGIHNMKLDSANGI